MHFELNQKLSSARWSVKHHD